MHNVDAEKRCCEKKESKEEQCGDTVENRVRASRAVDGTRRKPFRSPTAGRAPQSLNPGRARLTDVCRRIVPAARCGLMACRRPWPGITNGFRHYAAVLFSIFRRAETNFRVRNYVRNYFRFLKNHDGGRAACDYRWPLPSSVGATAVEILAGRPGLGPGLKVTRVAPSRLRRFVRCRSANPKLRPGNRFANHPEEFRL